MSENSKPVPPVSDPNAKMRSPVRPVYTPPPPKAPVEPRKTTQPQAFEPPEDPKAAMATLRQKMQLLVDEYAAGKINRAQFHALYKRYSEQRAVIEKLIERNPDSDAWKQVIRSQGQTGFLRSRLEAQPMIYAIFARNQTIPVHAGGKHPLNPEVTQPLLQALWRAPQLPAAGLGRKALDNDEWLVLAVGEYAATMVIFSLEPSSAQARLVRDLHLDFERANRMALNRGMVAIDRLVFPQRALVERGEENRR